MMILGTTASVYFDGVHPDLTPVGIVGQGWAVLWCVGGLTLTTAALCARATAPTDQLTTIISPIFPCPWYLCFETILLKVSDIIGIAP